MNKQIKNKKSKKKQKKKSKQRSKKQSSNNIKIIKTNKQSGGNNSSAKYCVEIKTKNSEGNFDTQKFVTVDVNADGSYHFSNIRSDKSVLVEKILKLIKESEELEKDLPEQIPTNVDPHVLKEKRKRHEEIIRQKQTQIKELFLDIFDDINKDLANIFFNDSTSHPNKEKVDRILAEIIDNLKQGKPGYLNSDDRKKDIQNLNILL